MALMGSLLCIVFLAFWDFSTLYIYLPPLVFPAILAIWLTMLLFSYRHSPLLRDYQLRKIASMIKKAVTLNKQVVVITGAGISTGSGIPDYVSGAWMDPNVPLSQYSYEQFSHSPSARQLYWHASQQFKAVCEKAEPNSAHIALTKLQQQGMISHIITQNVDGLHQQADSKHVIELHGNMSHTHCLSCRKTYDWPQEGAQDYANFYCVSCGGLIKPHVVAMDEQIPLEVWQKAQTRIENAAALLIIGTQLSISSANMLIKQAQGRGIPLLVINQGPVIVHLSKGDQCLNARCEIALPALVDLLH